MPAMRLRGKKGFFHLLLQERLRGLRPLGRKQLQRLPFIELRHLPLNYFCLHKPPLLRKR